MTIPGSMAEVSPQWIEQCVGRGKLKKINLVPMPEGVGMMSSMSVIELDWEDPAGLPASLVLKLAAENETNRAVSQQFNLYLKEVSYYKDLAPRTTARSRPASGFFPSDRQVRIQSFFFVAVFDSCFCVMNDSRVFSSFALLSNFVGGSCGS